MLSVLASGALVADPVERTSAAGKVYVTANMRVAIDGEDAILASLIAFSDTAKAAILALSRGDSLSIVGRAKLSTWTKDGEQRHGLSIVAEQVLTAYMLEKRRQRSRSESETG